MTPDPYQEVSDIHLHFMGDRAGKSCSLKRDSHVGEFDWKWVLEFDNDVGLLANLQAFVTLNLKNRHG